MSDHPMTWKCAKCHTIHHVTSGWKFKRIGRYLRRVCHACYGAKP